MTIRKKIIIQQQGQSLVEFALIMPILVIILFGIIEWGRLWMTMNVLSGAAREGARVAAVTAPDPALVQNAVANVQTAANITGGTITVSAPDAANQVTVAVQFNYTVLTGALVPGLGGTLQLTRRAVMRWEG